MSKGDQNFLKIQTCVLKVHIHCDGCKQKVKKLLQKIDGVYTVSIDSDHSKVTVSGSVDPSTLIKKLSKSGKHAELLAPKGGSSNSSNKNSNGNNNSNNNFLEQLQKLKLEGGKSQQKDNGKPQKGKGDDGGGGAKDKKGQQPPLNMFKDLKLPQLKGFNFPPQKDQKSVKFSLPDDFDDGSDFDDDEFDDDYYDDDDDFDDLDGIDDDDDFDDVLKPMNAKPMSDNKKGNDKKGGEKNNGGKKDGKTGEKDNKGGSSNNGKNSKKGGEKNEVPAMNPKMMGHGHNIGNGPIGAIQGIPQGAAIQGMPVANPYQQQQQQQYMAMMRQHQQQQQQQMMMNMNNGPTVYGQPMGFMPAPPAYAEPYTNYFSDENTNSSCSVM